MRCKACDQILSDYELRYLDRATLEPLDLCSTCLSYSNKAISDWDSIVDTNSEIDYTIEDDLFYALVEEIGVDN